MMCIMYCKNRSTAARLRVHFSKVALGQVRKLSATWRVKIINETNRKNEKTAGKQYHENYYAQLGEERHIDSTRYGNCPAMYQVQQTEVSRLKQTERNFETHKTMWWPCDAFVCNDGYAQKLLSTTYLQAIQDDLTQ